MDRILIIDDDEILANALADGFRYNDFEPLIAPTAKDGLYQVRNGKPDVILLDLGLPDMDGFDLLKEIRKIDQSIRLIIITSKFAEYSQVSAFTQAADDYITKPCPFEVILARVHNALNHSRTPVNTNIFQSGDLLIDYDKKVVTLAGEPIELTALEYDILVLLTKQADQYLDYDYIMGNIGKNRYSCDKETLRTEIRRLRTKIETNPDNPEFLTCKYGIGYKFNLR